MSAKKLLVVIGATGNQGGSVVKTFLNNSEWQIRGVTRDTSSKSAQNLVSQGVEMVVASLDDRVSLEKAFGGAYAIYSVTDFWHPYMDPSTDNLVKAGQMKNQAIYDYELQQGKNVIDAAASTKGLQRFIFSSLPDTLKWSKGKYSSVYHFNSKADAQKYGETTHPDLWAKTSVIYIGLYLSNFLGMGFAPVKVDDGQYRLFTSINGDTQLPLIAAEEDTGPSVQALLSAAPGKVLISYREFTTLNDFFARLSKALGVNVELGPLTYQQICQNTGPELGPEFADTYGFFNDFGYEAREDPEVVHPKDLGVSISLPSIENWIEKQDWTKVLSGQI